MVATSTLLTACDDAVARLQEEKLALIQAVLALKAKERAYWQAALVREQAFGAPVATATATPTPTPTQPQPTDDEHARKVRSYAERIAAAEASVAELREMQEQCRRQVERHSAATRSRGADDLARILARLTVRDEDV